MQMFRRCDARWIDLPCLSNILDIPIYKAVEDDPAEGELSLEEWMIAMEPFHLRVKDITKDTIDLLLLDRNVFDLAEHNTGKPPLNPTDFFVHNYRISYSAGEQLIEGNAMWSGDNVTQRFRLHLDLGDYWYPTDGTGNVPKHMWGNLQTGRKLNPEDRVGWRGPCMPWELLAHCPKIYYELN